MKKSFYATLLLITGLIAYGCGSNSQNVNLDKNREVVKAYHDVWNNGHIDELDKLLTPDYIGHFVSGLELKGLGGAKSGITKLRTSFPDWREDIVDIVAEGDKVVTRYKSSGTHRGKYKDLDSTGKKVAMYEVSIYRLVNGKIAEDWSYFDPASLANQLKQKTGLPQNH